MSEADLARATARWRADPEDQQALEDLERLEERLDFSLRTKDELFDEDFHKDLERYLDSMLEPMAKFRQAVAKVGAQVNENIARAIQKLGDDLRDRDV